MDSRESLASPQPPPPPSSSLQHHHHQPHHHHHQQPPPPPGMMMMPPNSYSPHHHHHLSNNSTDAAIGNNKNANLITPNSMQQQRFPFNNSDQFGDGSSPSAGFMAGGYGVESAKKKRGRPRKYSPSGDGGIALGLAPAPVNAVVAGAGGCGNLENSNDGSGGTPNLDSSSKKHRGRPPGPGKKQLDALGLPGVGFTPHVIIVKAGEDISTTMMSFSQQGPRTVCILAANGAISNVTLRQPASSGGSVTYEGRFEIISLSGSFVHSESDGNSKPSGLSVSLAGSDGRVLGGGVAGMLVAASPVQVIVGSFIADAKKPKSSAGPSPVAPPNMLSFGGGGGAVPGISPPSEGPSSETSDESGSSPLHRIPGSYNNANQHHQQQQQQQQPPPPQHMQNLSMYSNMGWPSSTMNMLPN